MPPSCSKLLKIQTGQKAISDMISCQFGGGRTIRPGEVLETEEDRAAKNERTRQLLAAYKKKVGLNIDPKLRSECEKVFKLKFLLLSSYYQTKIIVS